MKWVHLRYHDLACKGPKNPKAIRERGGATIGLRLLDNNNIEYAFTICRHDENFCRDYGRDEVTDRFEKGEFYKLVNEFGTVESALDNHIIPKVQTKMELRSGIAHIEDYVW